MTCRRCIPSSARCVRALGERACVLHAEFSPIKKYNGHATNSRNEFTQLIHATNSFHSPPHKNTRYGWQKLTPPQLSLSRSPALTPHRRDSLKRIGRPRERCDRKRVSTHGQVLYLVYIPNCAHSLLSLHSPRHTRVAHQHNTARHPRAGRPQARPHPHGPASASTPATPGHGEAGGHPATHLSMLPSRPSPPPLPLLATIRRRANIQQFRSKQTMLGTILSQGLPHRWWTALVRWKGFGHALKYLYLASSNSVTLCSPPFGGPKDGPRPYCRRFPYTR